jgi:hypothetical protein
MMGLSSIVWLDAFKPEDGQKPIDFTNEGFRKAFLSSKERGEPGFPVPPPKLPSIFVNEKDRAYVDSKLTPQHCERVIRTAAWGFLEDDEPREYRKRRDHQQLIIVDVCDDLRLLRDVASSAARPAAVTSVLRTSSTLVIRERRRYRQIDQFKRAGATAFLVLCRFELAFRALNFAGACAAV